MYNVQKELQDLRAKVKNAELAMQRDEKIRKLTQERDWFCKESLRLDSYSTSIKKELKFMEEKLQSVEEDRVWLEKQLKAAKKQNKLLRTELELHIEQATGASGAGNQLELADGMPRLALTQGSNQESGRAAQDSSASARRRMRGSASQGHLVGNGAYDASAAQPANSQGGIPRSKSTAAQLPVVKDASVFDAQVVDFSAGYASGERAASSSSSDKHTIRVLREQLQRERDQLRDLRASVISERTDRSELENFFLKCIEEVKKDVARRRLKAKLQSSKRSTRDDCMEPTERDLKAIRLQDMTPFDRKRVMDVLFDNEDVSTVLFDNIFGNKGAGQEATAVASPTESERASVGPPSMSPLRSSARLDLPSLLQSIS